MEKSGIFIADLIVKLEDIAVGVAKNEIHKEDVKKIFRSMFESFDYSVDL